MIFDAIAFDADDTLWDNEYLYTQAKARFAGMFSDCCSQEACLQRLEEIESHNVRYYGYGIKSFILSMIEAALELSGGQAPAEVITSILATARQMLSADVLLIDGVGETLEALAQRCPLMLITKGDPSEQRPKILHSGLSGYFRWVEVVHEKTPEVYRAILERCGLRPERFLMVGNSLRSDILPVLAIGARAVYIPYADTWSHELVDEDPVGEYTTLENLRLLPGYVEKLMQDS
ncbi:MAG: HAD family hydrolase [Anaerolineales bacterium]|nr:HAD family hydrolase [Anaerolineales bacterium]